MAHDFEENSVNFVFAEILFRGSQVDQSIVKYSFECIFFGRSLIDRIQLL